MLSVDWVVCGRGPDSVGSRNFVVNDSGKSLDVSSAGGSSALRLDGSRRWAFERREGGMVRMGGGRPTAGRFERVEGSEGESVHLASLVVQVAPMEYAPRSPAYQIAGPGLDDHPLRPATIVRESNTPTRPRNDSQVAERPMVRLDVRTDLNEIESIAGEDRGRSGKRSEAHEAVSVLLSASTQPSAVHGWLGTASASSRPRGRGLESDHASSRRSTHSSGSALESGPEAAQSPATPTGGLSERRAELPISPHEPCSEEGLVEAQDHLIRVLIVAIRAIG